MARFLTKCLGYGVIGHPDPVWLMSRLWSARPSETDAMMTAALKARPSWDDMSAEDVQSALGRESVLQASMSASGMPGSLMQFVHTPRGGTEAPDEKDWWILQPPSMAAAWTRQNDIIDQAELAAAAGPPAPWAVVTEMPRGPFPFEQLGQPMTETSGADELGTPVVPAIIRVIAEHLRFPDWRAFRPVVARWAV